MIKIIQIFVLDFSGPLTHHYKKCPVMWTIIGLISKNPEISLASRNNPEMSECSSDLPMSANFSIYIYISMGSFLNWAVSLKLLNLH